MSDPLDNKKEACKTYIEQTKQLMTLASAFLFAPAGLVAILKDKTAITQSGLRPFVLAEASLIFSVVMGYIVLASITGTQEDGTYDVYRPAMRCFSILQFAGYLVGIVAFMLLVWRALI